MSDSSKKVSVTAEIPEDLYKSLLALAEKRGVSANTVLSQAINTEKYLSESEAAGDKVLMETPDRRLERLTRKK
jgi:predicted transcriptional regulator